MEIESMIQLATDADTVWGKFAPVMKAKAWKSWDESDQISFRNALATVIALTEDLKSDFDNAVWRGHDDGTVKRSVQSIRTRTVHETKPGKPAPTAEMLKARALAKKGIVLATVTPVTDEVTEESAE